MQHGDVVELQKRLRAEGFFTHPTDTGLFGPATFAAVQQYQRKYGINPTGYVGPMTREKLNGSSAPAGDEISLADFVRLLIAVGVIPPEKAALALKTLEGL
jgi:murein L,D-transpeptidase YcbB/YkuD